MFFAWLEQRTRDAILDGAVQATRVLGEGTGSISVRTESVTTFDVTFTHQAVAAPAAEPLPEPGQGGSESPAPNPRMSLPPARGQQRPGPENGGRKARKGSKSETMFDAGPDRVS